MAKIGNIQEVQSKLINGVFPVTVLVKQSKPKHTFEIELTSENWHATSTMEDDEEFSNWSVEAKLGNTIFTVYIDLIWGDIELSLLARAIKVIGPQKEYPIIVPVSKVQEQYL